MDLSRLERTCGSPSHPSPHHCLPEPQVKITPTADLAYPQQLAAQRMEMCTLIAHTALERCTFCDRLERLYQTASRRNGADFHESARQAAGRREALRSLGRLAQHTADSLQREVCSLEEWNRRARAGLVLDVFNLTSLQVLLDYLEDSRGYVEDALAFLEGLEND